MQPKNPGSTIVDPNRVVERGRGCWNCIHYENETLARQRYREHRDSAVSALAMRPEAFLGSADALVPSSPDFYKLVAKHAAAGLSESDAVDQALREDHAKNGNPTAIDRAQQMRRKFQMFDQGITNGSIGMCMRAMSGTDFVFAKFLCGAWSGKQGSSLATSGRALDKLPDELRDIADSKARRSE